MLGVTSLSIAATAERTGVSPHTLRYYERIGLIDPVGRDEAGRRVYSDADLLRVDFLRKLRSTGTPITRMQEYVELVARVRAPSKRASSCSKTTAGACCTTSST